MQAGDYEDGCPALEESYRIEPLAGVLFTTAECHARWGKTATAVARYQDYVNAFARMPTSQRVKQQRREEIARKQIAALQPKVPKLTLRLPDSVPAGTAVKREGITLGKPSLGVPIPVDPGEHVVTTEVPGGPLHQQRISIAAGEKKTVELEIVLPAVESADTPSSAAVATVHTPAADRPTSSSRRTIAYVVGGIGVAGVVAGSVTGALVFSKKSTVEDNCQDTACNLEGKEAADSAKVLGLVSTVGFGVGIAGLATGALLLLTEPNTEKVGRRTIVPVVAAGGRSAHVGFAGSF
jgi:hypothetical protein